MAGELALSLASIDNKDTLTLEGMDRLSCALNTGSDNVLPNKYPPTIWHRKLRDENAVCVIA
jgi:hypothetical protein